MDRDKQKKRDIISERVKEIRESKRDKRKRIERAHFRMTCF